MEKEHAKEFKKTRTVLKKRTESAVKLERKLKKGKTDAEMLKLRDNMVKDVQMKSQMFEEQERMAVKEIACQERTHYTTFAACLKPMVMEELAMLREVEQLEDVMEKIDRIIADPFKNLETSNNIFFFAKNSEETFSFSTPPPSPALRSRTASVSSTNSSSCSSYSSIKRSKASRINSVSSETVS